MGSVLRQWSVWMRKREDKKIRMKDEGRLGERACKGGGWGGACLGFSMWSVGACVGTIVAILYHL